MAACLGYQQTLTVAPSSREPSIQSSDGVIVIRDW